MGLGHRRVTRYILSKSKLKFCFFLVYSSTKVFYLKVFSIKRMRDGGRYIILLIFVLGKSLAQEDGEVAPGAKLGQNLGAVDSNAKLGQNKGLNVTCGKWTTRLVTVST